MAGRRYIYFIPMNFENGSRLFGSIKIWNAVETAIICGGLGFIEIKLMQLFSLPLSSMVWLMSITLLPLGFLSAVGIDGCDLVRFLVRMLKSMKNRKHIVRRDLYNATMEERQDADRRKR